MILPPRVSLRLLLAAGLLTALTAVLRWGVVPSHGFVRAFYPTADFQSPPAAEDRTPDVSLEFLRRSPSLPRRSFGVQWRGFWYVPQERTLVLRMSSDDEVQVLIDGTVVMRRNARELPHAAQRSLTLAEGTHEIVIRYRQHGRGMGLGILAGPSGATPAPLPVESIFTSPVTRRHVMIAAALPWLMAVTALMWLMAGGWAIADRVVQARQRGWRLGLPAPRIFARRLLLIAGPALVGPIVLFLVGPTTIHGANPDEFVVLFTEIIWPWTIGAIVVSWALLLAVGAVACLIAERLTRIYAAVLLAVGFLLWAQGTFLIADYGPLNGEMLDLGAHAGRVPYELAAWGGVLVLAVVFARRVSGVASLLSLSFVGLQIVAAGVPLAKAVHARGAKSGWSAPPSDLYTLSRSDDVIHIVLDAYLSELFGEAIAEDRAFFDRTFSGFVYFANHLGAFPTTRASMPAMLTGLAYRNEEPFEAFSRRALQRRSIASAFADRGFQVRSITFHPGEHPSIDSTRPPTVTYTIPTPYGSYQDYVRFTALQLFDFAAFRHVPQVLKPSVYNDDTWLFQGGMSGNTLESQRSRTARPSNHAAFLAEMADRLTVGTDVPVYQFIHVALPHLPLVLDGGCTFSPPRRPTRPLYAAQSRCAVSIVGRILDRLRALGVYDQSVIVLASDHGWRLPGPNHPLSGVSTPAGDLQSLALTAMPLLVVKPKGASGPLRISMAPTAITDIPATIADLAGLPPGLFPGEPVLHIAEDAKRSRSFAFHSWGNGNADWSSEYLDALHVFAVDGPIHQPGSWRLQRTIPDPARAPTRR